MVNLSFKPIDLDKIPKRGKYRDVVKKQITLFLELMKNGVDAVESSTFTDRKEAMGYYDSFDYYVKKKGLPIKIMIRTNENGTFSLFLANSQKIS